MSYVNISTKINEAIKASVEEGAKTDEILAALCVLREVWTVLLAQSIMTPPTWAPVPEKKKNDTADKDAE